MEAVASVETAQMRVGAIGRTACRAMVVAVVSVTVVPLVNLVSARPAVAVGTSFTAYVADEYGNDVVPIATATGSVGTPLATGSDPDAIAITPDGKTAYAVNYGGQDAVPIDTATNTMGTAIGLGSNIYPTGIAITPDGQTAYVTDAGPATITPIDIATNTPETPIVQSPNNADPTAVAITPDGKTAYVTDSGNQTVVPISTATNTLGTAISLPGGSNPIAIAITPDGKTAYVADLGTNMVTPINVATNTLGTAISLPGGSNPFSIAITPDGKTAYVTDNGTSKVTPIDLTTDTAGTPISLASGALPRGIAITPDGQTAYVADWGTSTVTPINLDTNTAETPITQSGTVRPGAVAITPDQAPTASFSAVPGKAGTTTTFDASTSSAPAGTISSYRWTFGDGISITTSSPSIAHVYANSGPFIVTLTVTDSAGTSTVLTFTGQTVSNNGEPSALMSGTVIIPASGYRLGAADGGVFSYGASFAGSHAGVPLDKPIVGMASTPDGKGYWLVGADGGVFAYGDAAFDGSHGRIAAHRAHRGHGVDARRQGLLAGGLRRRRLRLRRRRVLRVARPACRSTSPSWAWRRRPTARATGWSASDGGVFAYGDATLRRIARGVAPLNKPIVGMAPTADGKGYWLVGVGRRSLRLRRRHVLRIARGVPAQRAHRRHGVDTRRQGVLAGRLRRRRLRLRRRHLRRVPRMPPRCRRRWWAWRWPTPSSRADRCRAWRSFARSSSSLRRASSLSRRRRS